MNIFKGFESILIMDSLPDELLYLIAERLTDYVTFVRLRATFCHLYKISSLWTELWKNQCLDILKNRQFSPEDQVAALEEVANHPTPERPQIVSQCIKKKFVPTSYRDIFNRHFWLILHPQMSLDRFLGKLRKPGHYFYFYPTTKAKVWSCYCVIDNQMWHYIHKRSWNAEP